MDGRSGAEELQSSLAGASVIKAFNTLFATNQANPTADIDGYIAGDDANAKRHGHGAWRSRWASRRSTPDRCTPRATSRAWRG